MITGATGSIGTELCTLLSAQGIPFRAMVRSVTKAQVIGRLPGATLIPGDFTDPQSMAAALEGVERAFLLTNSSEQAATQQNSFVTAAQQAGVQHIVKLSQWAADLYSPVRFLRYHAAVEQTILQSGLAYTFLRPNLFMQGLLGFREPIIHQHQFFAAIGTARISVVDIRDIAAVAAATLNGQGHEGKTYHLTGPKALTHYEMAAALSQALGQPIQFADVPPAAMLQALTAAGFPGWQAEGLLEDYAHYAREEAAVVTSDILTVTGQPARSFEVFARDYAPAFS